MLNAAFDWWNALPGGALFMEILMLGMTVALVRSSMHPTTFALVAWPGTTAHEASHGLVGLLLGAKPCEFSLFPKKAPDGESWILGYVAFSNLKWWNAPFTAMAPLMLAPIAIWLVAEWAYPWLAKDDLPAAAWRLGVCCLIFQASWPSRQDFKVAAPGLLVLGLLAWWLL